MSPAKCEVHLRFWDKVDWSGDCWMWLSATTGTTHGTGGYGIIGYNRRHALAHRLTYEWAKGPIPEGLELDHLCRNPSCVNPDHLEAVTHQENARRHHNQKTHCPRGHPYDEVNTYVHNGRRFCRPCANDSRRAKRAAKRVAA